MAIVPHIIDQHAEEAAFLWLLRDDAIHAPHYRLADLCTLDARVDAHLDGLRIAGDEGLAALNEQLEIGEPGEVFVATVMGADHNSDLLDAALQRATEHDLERAVVSALGWIDAQRAQAIALSLLESERRYVGLAALAVHRTGPEPSLLQDLITDEDPRVRARAAQAAGELGRSDMTRDVEKMLDDDDEQTALPTIRAAGLLGIVGTGQRARAWAESGSLFASRFAALAARFTPPEQIRTWVEHRLRDDPVHTGCAAAGALGDPAFVPALIDLCANDECSRTAGDAIAMITGADLAFDDLDREWPPGFVTGPTEDPDDESVELDPDEDLPFADPERIEAWWRTRESSLTPGVRCIGGQPLSIESLDECLRNGVQRHRHGAAMELVRLQPGSPLFETRARGDRQRQRLKEQRK